VGSEPVSVLDVSRSSEPAGMPGVREAVGEDEALAVEPVGRSAGEELAELLGEETIAVLAARARQQAAAGGLRLLGSDGLLQGITRRVIEAALEGELAEHLETQRAAASEGVPVERNGRRTKRLATEVGPVEVAVPRDRDGSFAPAVVGRHARRTSGIDEMVVSLVGKGLTTGEVAAHLHEVFGVQTSKETVSAVTDRVLDGMNEWRNRPLDAVYPVIVIDAVHVRIRDQQVANRAVYVALGIDVNGYRDILGLWAGDGGESAKTWLATLTELRNRGVRDVCLLLCDGLNGLPEAANAVWPQVIVQRCIIHLLRSSYKYASRKDWAAIAKDLKPVYTASSAEDALDRFAELAGVWEKKYPAIVRLWERAWPELVPFLSLDREIRVVISTTNAVESLNARLRRAVNASGHLPTEQAALKRLYLAILSLAILSLDPTGRARQRWSNRWKAALNAFEVAFDGRLHPDNN
jgi:putative transposase